MYIYIHYIYTYVYIILHLNIIYIYLYNLYNICWILLDCIIFYLSKLLQIILNIPELEYINHDQTHT